jgi:coenzyme PQQ precursor peptide PqqA
LGWVCLLAPIEPGHGESLIAFDAFAAQIPSCPLEPAFAKLGKQMPACAISGWVLSSFSVRRSAVLFERRSEMAWKTPTIVEVPVGMEINMYACAARK